MEDFGVLLRRYRLHTQTKNGKPLSQVALGERLGRAIGLDSGYSGAAVSDWERNKSQIHKDDRVILLHLIQILYQLNGIATLTDANKLLQVGNYRALSQIEIKQIDASWLNETEQSLYARNTNHLGVEGNVVETTLNISRNVDSQPYFATYAKFFGREQELIDVINRLSATAGRQTVAIEGIGGIGKSAVLSEVIQRCGELEIFTAVVALSAEINSFDPTPTLSFETVLNEIGRQLSFVDFVQRPLTEKVAYVRRVLQTRKILIALDNLETSAIQQDRLVEELQSCLGISRLVVASRHRFTGDVYNVRLLGFDQHAGREFLQREATDKQITTLVQISDFDDIISKTGGSPLAMKLVISQLKRLPLETILSYLTNVQPLGSNYDEDQNIRFYKHIFWHSWQLLTQLSQDLLVEITAFPGGKPTYAALQQISSLSAENVTVALNDLLSFSFVEIVSGLTKHRYFLHPLTHYFVLSDIVKPHAQ